MCIFWYNFSIFCVYLVYSLGVVWVYFVWARWERCWNKRTNKRTNERTNPPTHPPSNQHTHIHIYTYPTHFNTLTFNIQMARTELREATQRNAQERQKLQVGYKKLYIYVMLMPCLCPSIDRPRCMGAGRPCWFGPHTHHTHTRTHTTGAAPRAGAAGG